MGLIINPRGTSGAGKTEFVRRIMSEYGRKGRVVPLYREGRSKPIAYELEHPRGGRSLVVLGHYEATRGGCDMINMGDGGMDEVFRLATDFASTGRDVLLEGLSLSGERTLSAALAAEHDLHILRLGTPLEQCVRNVIRRQRAKRAAWARISQKAYAEEAKIALACGELEPLARVEVLGFDEALSRAKDLLRTGSGPACARMQARLNSHHFS